MRVYLTSPWIPTEWIRAHGHEPRNVLYEENFSHHTPPISAGVCAYAKRFGQFADSQPDAAVVFTTACDQMRRTCDTAIFRGQSRAFLFNLPASAAQEIYRAEVKRLGNFLVEIGGSSPTAEFLQHELLRANETRRLLLEAAPVASARSFAEAIALFHRQGTFSAPTRCMAEGKFPLALIGGPLSRADWEWFDLIESFGGRVALNATKIGERSLCPFFENGRDPFDALVTGYFKNIVDGFQRPNARLYSWLKPRLVSRHIRGIVLWCCTGCDLWRAEAQTLREAFGLPVLLIEADEGVGVSSRDRTRLQAFVETLK
jgi:benzoyl-CoA reductase/2-hydroxyglutaryl-CoA dehydratase subunit BcrC/BadD/HgdB